VKEENEDKPTRTALKESNAAKESRKKEMRLVLENLEREPSPKFADLFDDETPLDEEHSYCAPTFKKRDKTFDDPLASRVVQEMARVPFQAYCASGNDHVGYTKPQAKKAKRFTRRSFMDETGALFLFVTDGLDTEDMKYMERCYNAMLASDELAGYEWLNKTHWVDHPPTNFNTYEPPPKKGQPKQLRARTPSPHKTGCARTEGYYKLDSKTKAQNKVHE
jgi:histone-lysine N-methyltransferase SETD1